MALGSGEQGVWSSAQVGMPVSGSGSFGGPRVSLRGLDSVTVLVPLPEDAVGRSQAGVILGLGGL